VSAVVSAGFRETVREFLADELPPDWVGLGALDAIEAEEFAGRWRQVLHRRGYLAPAWPVAYGGGGLTQLEQVILAEELARAGVPAGIGTDVFGINMLGNTLLAWGTEEQRQRFLPRILSGEDRWCQGFSEPGAGSDLAGLRTRAELDGDEWVVNGQKVWTSGAQWANWIFVLVRTDPTAPRHQGFALLLVPMDQPGVDVRPIRNIAGDTHFNEVFFTDARCPRANVVGPVGEGWRVAMTLLGFERGDAAATFPVMFRVELDRLLALANENGAADDPVIRDRLADAYVDLEVMHCLGLDSLSRYLQGEPPGPDAAVSKLFWSEYHQKATELALDVLDSEALVVTGRPATTLTVFQTDDVGAPNDSASWISTALMARAGTIYAGASEIQRNIIAEKLMGLPR
jgi:alkylation response protein AidB-like acyl-CoA dehydrogenase